MKKYKVIQLIHGLTMGGAETLVKDYVRLLGEEFESIVVTTDRRRSINSANEKLVNDAGIRIIEIGKRIRLGKLSNIFFYKCLPHLKEKKIALELLKIIEEENPECIHIHLQQLKYIQHIYNRLDKVRLIYTCHSEVERMFGKGYEVERNMMSKLLENNQIQILALHKKMEKDINELFDVDNTKVLPNGIELKRFQNNHETRKTVREKLGFSKDDFVIGHVGRFHPLKNHEFLLKVFVQIYQKQGNAKLLLVGNGNEYKKIRSIIKEKGIESQCVILSNRSDVDELLSGMDVFVFPSILEGLGTALIEAQAAKLRCVVSDTIPEEAIISSNTSALSLTKDSVEDWARIIIKHHNTIDDKMDGINKFDMMVVIEKLEQIYRGD